MKENQIEFLVPLLPPSVNHYKLPSRHGGWYRCPAAEAFIAALPLFAAPAAPSTWPWFRPPFSQPQRPRRPGAVYRPFYEVELTFRIRRLRFLNCDSDNLEKVAFDALARCGVISDDRYIKYHTNRALPVETAAEESTHYVVRITKPEAGAQSA